jgi:hypothetical protein
MDDIVDLYLALGQRACRRLASAAWFVTPDYSEPGGLQSPRAVGLILLLQVESTMAVAAVPGAGRIDARRRGWRGYY